MAHLLEEHVLAAQLVANLFLQLVEHDAIGAVNREPNVVGQYLLQMFLDLYLTTNVIGTVVRIAVEG